MGIASEARDASIVAELRSEVAAARSELDKERGERERLQRLLDAARATQRHPDGAEEQAIRESEERFRLLVEHVGDAVFMVDPTGKVVTWTPAAERILGYTETEALLLRREDFIPDEPPKGSDASRASRASAELATARQAGRCELNDWRIGKGDRRLWAHVVICPIMGPTGELRGFAEIVRDRTVLRKAEEALAYHAEELARSNKELERFASVAAHDLQEPLRKLRMFADRLKRRFASSLDSDATALVERMDESATRMQQLIDGVLAYARVGRKTGTSHTLELDRVIAETLEDLSASIEKAQARVQVTHLPNVSVNATAMHQILQNLLSNAIKFARPDVPLLINITARRSSESTWELRIEDNGIGFDPKYSERIFGLFERLHGRSEYPGSGLGLAICRRLIEAHRGSITAEGRPGEGAVFTIRLPS